MSYIGRFAPSPSGPLHFGSLVTALGSYLQAKSNQGEWLVRIEDIDPPREMKGAVSLILTALEQFELYWDKQVEYQSTRSQIYLDTLDFLLNHQLAYYCDCNRKRIRGLSDQRYDGFCRNRSLALNSNYQNRSHHQHFAIRLKQTSPIYQFYDQIRGLQIVAKHDAQEDFIIYRRDGQFAYNLAVVLDDHLQGVTQVVRGADLLPVTAKQLSLYQLFGWQAPSYCHLPLALDANWHKLSKQNHAQPLVLSDVKRQTISALRFLGQQIPEKVQDANQTELLDWAVKNWNLECVPRQDLTANIR